MSDIDDIDSMMTLAPVIPVLVIEDLGHARPIAEALVKGGLRVIEVTLRTPVAHDAIRAMAEVDGAIVGAGTVLNANNLATSLDTGARFIVSPGLTQALAEAATISNIPYLPGIATASDIMRGLDLGLSRFKFFPATAAGGIPALKALSAPFPQCRFCPTGGITEANAAEWLALESVSCVGGSWIVPRRAPDPVKIAATANALMKTLSRKRAPAVDAVGGR
jgi:2-dehydro-3-deoxyphosphogluconate aldolase / (4S)-4-hydroxy-2-oxoglutarate aldolase